MDDTLTPTLLHGWLAAALSADAGARSSAERELQAAEEGAVPGLVGGLLDVVQAVGAVEEVSGERRNHWVLCVGRGGAHALARIHAQHTRRSAALQLITHAEDV